MPIDSKVVEALVSAAADGMMSYASTHRTTPEEVLNALLNMAARAVALCDDPKLSPEIRKHNRAALQSTLQQLLLRTADSERVV